MNYFSLRELFDLTTFDKIKSINTSLGLNITSNNNKRDLATMLTNTINYRHVFDQLIFYLDTKSYELLNKVIDNGFIIKEDKFKLYYETLCTYGFLFEIEDEGNIYYTSSKEMIEKIKYYKDKLEDEVKINDQIIRFGQAASAYYGLIYFNEAIELFTMYHPEIERELEKRLSFLSKTQSLFIVENDKIIDCSLEQVDLFIKDREKFSFLPLYKYTFDEFYLNENYIAIGLDIDSYTEIENYFKRHFICDPSIIISIYYYLMSSCDFNRLKKIIQDELNATEYKFDLQYDRYINKLYQSVRCWVTKGNSVASINKMIEKNPNLYVESNYVNLKKVELPKRNDYCYCKSGKKYKNCCMKKS